MTRRQASTAASSPRSLAASSTSQAMSTGDRSIASLLSLRSKEESMITSPGCCRSAVSVERQLGFAAGAGIAALARAVERQHASRRRDIEAAELALQVAQLPRVVSGIRGAEKQQRHCGPPVEVERLGDDQQHLAVTVDQRALDDIDRQRA